MAQEKPLTLCIKVYRDPEDSLRYKADITIDSITDNYTINTGGYIDRKFILNYILTNLLRAQDYLRYLERAQSETSKMYNHHTLKLRLGFALADALAYEIGQDNLIPEDPCRLWKAIGETWCHYTECIDFVKEDFEACMETCKKAWCGATQEGRASEKYPGG